MKKLLNKKGFTLMEMMIVIAIIVILVAIAVPTFSGSLDKANAATDAANLRAAKAAIVALEMDGTSSAEGMIYDVTAGDLVEAPTEGNPAGSGKCSTHEGAWIEVIGGEAKWTKDGTTALGECGSN